MEKRVLVLIIMVLIVIILIPLAIVSSNSYARKQRESIKYCEVDEDCIIQNYRLKGCAGMWAGCFNKNEKPRNDIKFGGRICDYPPNSCMCNNGKCIDCPGTSCLHPSPPVINGTVIEEENIIIGNFSNCYKNKEGVWVCKMS